jgi:hypothetical protein
MHARTAAAFAAGLLTLSSPAVAGILVQNQSGQDLTVKVQPAVGGKETKPLKITAGSKQTTPGNAPVTIKVVTATGEECSLTTGQGAGTLLVSQTVPERKAKHLTCSYSEPEKKK